MKVKTVIKRTWMTILTTIIIVPYIITSLTREIWNGAFDGCSQVPWGRRKRK